MRKFKLIKEHSEIAGISSGLAYSLGIQTWIIRCLFTVLILALGVFGIFIYLLIWIFAPKWEETPKDYKEICE